MKTLNEVFSKRSARQRYEVWFLRMGLADGSGAWWFRYLLMNPGRGGCDENPSGMPVQIWATWFPFKGKPSSFIQGFPLEGLVLSIKGQSPCSFQVGENAIGENSCRGSLQVVPCMRVAVKNNFLLRRKQRKRNECFDDLLSDPFAPRCRQAAGCLGNLGPFFFR